MAGIGPIVVASIAEAINKASDFPDAIAWMVAPLATRSGGKRSWQVFRVRSGEDHDEIVGWCKENDPGAKLPTLDVDLSELPELPPSKVQLWELVYIDGNSDLLGPRIWIDPTAASQPKTSEPTPQAAPAAPQQEKARQPDPTPPLGAEVILRAFEAQISANQAAQSQSLAAMKAVSDSIAQIAKGYAGVQDLLTDEIRRGREAITAAEALRDKAVESNIGLSAQLAEAREDSQLHLTIRELFKDKPELLVSSIAEMADAFLKRLSGAPS